MYQLVIMPRAIEMAKEVYNWYNEQQAGLGDLFLNEPGNGYNKLESWPDAYQKIKNNYRHLVLSTFLISSCSKL
jgi:hypothetical protein